MRSTAENLLLAVALAAVGSLVAAALSDRITFVEVTVIVFAAAAVEGVYSIVRGGSRSSVVVESQRPSTDADPADDVGPASDSEPADVGRMATDDQPDDVHEFDWAAYGQSVTSLDQPQCPSCGRLSSVIVVADNGGYICTACRNEWSVPNGEPWPATVGNPAESTAGTSSTSSNPREEDRP